MKKIILTRGIQGSGKSTWAKEYVSEKPEERIRFNNDDIRNMLGKYWVPSREGVVKHLKKEFMKYAMDNGYDIVLDNMNLNQKEVAWVEGVIKDHNRNAFNENCKYEMEFKDFFIPVEECILRDKQRPNPIGEKVIRETFRKYKSLIISEEIKKIKEKEYMSAGKDPNKKTCIIVDIDGTIALNTTSRPFYGNGAAEGMLKDEPINGIISLINAYAVSHDLSEIIVVTGRESTPEIKKATEDWLNKYKVCYDKIIMREPGDFSHGEDFKEKVYKECIKPYYNVDFAIEDNAKVVKRYRDLGLLVLQPNEGKF